MLSDSNCTNYSMMGYSILCNTVTLGDYYVISCN